MSDLDALLYAEPTSNMREVADALQQGYDERWQVDLIKRYLLTDTQRDVLSEVDATVSDLLNGRVEGDFDYARFFDVWNARLGRRVFGFAA